MTPSPTFTVLIVDDDEDVRSSIALLLRTVGFAARTFANPQEFISQEHAYENACLLFDVRMPGMSGLQLLEHLAANGENRPVIIMSGHADVNACRRAFKGGALDFLSKPIDETDLIEAIQSAQTRFEAERSARAESEENAALLARLPPREREILDLVIKGMASREIAELLNISPRTIDSHRGNIGEKLGTTSVAEMARMVLMADAGAHT
jgi:RNA polymerase sigma factor (sigma-70 family)